MLAKAPYGRHRETGGLTPVLITWNWWNTAQAIPPVNSRLYPNRAGYALTMDDVVTPNFRKLQAEGRVVNNPMSRIETTISGSDSGWKFRQDLSTIPPSSNYGECPSNWCICAYGPPGYSLDDGLIKQMRTQAATAAWAGVDSEAVNLSAALGEMKSTLNMLGDPVRAFSDFLWSRAWNDAGWNKARGKAQKAAALAKLISNLWLYERFAIRPFLMDIEAIIEELQSQKFSIRRTSRNTVVRRTVQNTSSVGSLGGVNIDFRTETAIDYKVRASIMYEARVTPAKSFGLHWQSLPITLWELTPWSFVADWLLNVGDYIQALTPKLDATILMCSTTVETTAEVIRESGAAWLNIAGWVTERSPRGADRLSQKIKRRDASVDAPGLVLETDYLEVFKNNRGVDAYMLFLQQFLRPISRASF